MLTGNLFFLRKFANHGADLDRGEPQRTGRLVDAFLDLGTGDLEGAFAQQTFGRCQPIEPEVAYERAERGRLDQ